METVSAVSETAAPKRPRKGNGRAAQATERAEAAVEASTDSPVPSSAAAAPDAANINVLSSAIGLMIASPRHRHLFLADLEWVLLPPLALKQFRLFTKDGRPVAFATWAFVSEEVAARLEAGAGKLKPSEWKSGDKCWIVELVAPFGGKEEFLSYLRTKMLEGHEARFVEERPSTQRVTHRE